MPPKMNSLILLAKNLEKLSQKDEERRKGVK